MNTEMVNQNKKVITIESNLISACCCVKRMAVSYDLQFIVLLGILFSYNEKITGSGVL